MAMFIDKDYVAEFSKADKRETPGLAPRYLARLADFALAISHGSNLPIVPVMVSEGCRLVIEGHSYACAIVMALRSSLTEKDLKGVPWITAMDETRLAKKVA